MYKRKDVFESRKWAKKIALRTDEAFLLQRGLEYWLPQLSNGILKPEVEKLLRRLNQVYGPTDKTPEILVTENTEKGQ